MVTIIHLSAAPNPVVGPDVDIDELGSPYPQGSGSAIPSRMSISTTAVARALEGEGVPFSRLPGKPMPSRDCLTLDIKVIDVEYRRICSIL